MLYSYRAVDRLGKSVSGSHEAASERELADYIKHEGFVLLDAGLPEGAKKGKSLFSREFINPFSRVTLVERMVFARNLAVMIGAGLVLNRALEALEEQTSNAKFKQIISSVRNDVVKGKTFAEALRPYEKIFGVLFINMVEAGEISGNLERVLKILARQMKRDHDIRAKVRGAMIYPAIVIFALVAIGVLMMIFVVPTLTQTFRELDVELPLTTRIILGASDLILHYYLYALVLLAAFVYGFRRVLKSKKGKKVFDAFILHVPVFGPLIQKLNSARFARTLSSLISSGVPIIRSLDITSAVLGNVKFREALEESSVAIQHGSPLSGVLKNHPNLFPAMVTQMLQVGEETGTTARMLLRLALFYEEEVTNITKNLSSIVEPVLMLFIGAAVGVFALSIIQPIYGTLGSL